MADQTDLRDILTSTTVGELELAQEAVLDLKPTDSVADAAAAMREKRRGSGVVCDGGKVVGIVTERDLLRVIANGEGLDGSLSDVMTADPRTMATEETLFEAIRLMNQGGYRRLPVVDPSGQPVGIFDVKTVVHFLVEHFPATVYNQASHEQLIAKHREGA